MPHKKSILKFEPELRAKTLELVRNRPRNMSYGIIAKNTGLEISWLKAFGQNAMTDPGVNKVEILYVYLNGRKLKV